MGLNSRGVEFLLAMTSAGDGLGRVATLGRQELHDVTPSNLQDLAARHDRQLGAAKAGAIVDAGFAEHLLEWLGATDVVSFDASDFEGASTVVDLNIPIGGDWRERFDLVLDGGTLEHVFNFPVALANAMDMVRPGGRLLHITPTNQEAGHGFYQLSPEVFFRSLCPDNGYEIERVLLREETTKGIWREVPDPDALRHRVQFTTATKAYLYISARRVSTVPLFTTWPQQSDYVSDWRDSEREPWVVRTSRARKVVAHLVPEPLQARLRPLRRSNSTHLGSLGTHLAGQGGHRPVQPSTGTR